MVYHLWSATLWELRPKEGCLGLGLGTVWKGLIPLGQVLVANMWRCWRSNRSLGPLIGPQDVSRNARRSRRSVGLPAAVAYRWPSFPWAAPWVWSPEMRNSSWAEKIKSCAAEQDWKWLKECAEFQTQWLEMETLPSALDGLHCNQQLGIYSTPGWLSDLWARLSAGAVLVGSRDDSVRMIFQWLTRNGILVK